MGIIVIVLFCFFDGILLEAAGWILMLIFVFMHLYGYVCRINFGAGRKKGLQVLVL